MSPLISPFLSPILSLWRFTKAQYDRILKIAGTALAVRLMLLFALLESIIIPIPVDPLLVATVLARPAKWVRLALYCTLASTIGGGIGWIIGAALGVGVDQILALLPHSLVAPSAFAAVQDGFVEWGILLVFIGAFSPLPYKVIAVSAGISGFAILPFLLVSLIGRGLRFVIVAGIARHHGDARIVILLITALVALIGGAIWLTG
ncbi:hypothetical protein N9368_02345 [Alphaproteobacteria bacterium]|nr:hypothetical protein [Alphaproteobacteria bacterium]